MRSALPVSIVTRWACDLLRSVRTSARPGAAIARAHHPKAARAEMPSLHLASNRMHIRSAAAPVANFQSPPSGLEDINTPGPVSHKGQIWCRVPRRPDQGFNCDQVRHEFSAICAHIVSVLCREFRSETAKKRRKSGAGPCGPCLWLVRLSPGWEQSPPAHQDGWRRRSAARLCQIPSDSRNQCHPRVAIVHRTRHGQRQFVRINSGIAPCFCHICRRLRRSRRAPRPGRAIR